MTPDQINEVTITVTARRSTSIDTGKVFSESKTYIVTDFYTDEELVNLLLEITPTV
jgi:hypothetical protein